MLSKMLATLAVGLTSIAFVAGAPLTYASASSSHGAAPLAQEGEIEVTRGKIISVKLENFTFTIQTDQDEEATFIVNDKTRYTLNGEEASAREALQKGAKAQVGHNGTTALKVNVTTRKDGR